MAHASKTHDGSRVLRWDAGTHRGCPHQDCRNAHGTLGKLHFLGPARKIVRRGGFKEEKKLEAPQAAQRIDTLRKGIPKKAASDRNPPARLEEIPPDKPQLVPPLRRLPQARRLLQPRLSRKCRLVR